MKTMAIKVLNENFYRPQGAACAKRAVPNAPLSPADLRVRSPLFLTDLFGGATFGDQIERIGHPAVAKAWVGCGFSLHLRNGYETSDSCGSNLPDEPLETLVVSRGDRLTFDGGGWSILEWWQATTGAFRGEPAVFEETEGGFLRSASSPPVDFPVPKSVGIWTLGLGTCVVRDGSQICGTWYVKVDVR